jgi:hypothetical protein
MQNAKCQKNADIGVIVPFGLCHFPPPPRSGYGETSP